MALVCSHINVTWFDGVWPSESGARVLLDEDEKIDEGSPLSGSVEQLVQRADYVRGAAPDFWVRGSRTTALEWDRVRPYDRHDAALAAALESAEDLPTGAGWVRLELPEYGRTWVITPAAIRRTEWRYDIRRGHLLQRWSVDCGTIGEIATEAEDYALTAEIGVELITEDGLYYLAQEDAA